MTKIRTITKAFITCFLFTLPFLLCSCSQHEARSRAYVISQTQLENDSETPSITKE